MAGERLSMRKTREILKQKWLLERSHREVCRSLDLSVGMVSATLGRAESAGLETAVSALSDREFEARLYAPGRENSTESGEIILGELTRVLAQVGIGRSATVCWPPREWPLLS